MDNEKYVATDSKATVLRLNPKLREYLQRAAAINGRSLSKEINTRLIAAVNAEKQRDQRDVSGLPDVSDLPPFLRPAITSGDVVQQTPPPYSATEFEQALLDLFRAMPTEKKLALLTVLKKS